MTIDADDQTFIFADLSGFTALTEAHGDERAADLVGDFGAAVRELLPEHRASEIKAIGDALMLRAVESSSAIKLGLRIVEVVGNQHGFPMVRVGMHTGPAVHREGDWFGTTVNVAARVSGLASAGQVLLTESTRRSAGSLKGIDLQQRGRQRLKNVAEPVVLYAAFRDGHRSAGGLPIDPVCRMAVSLGLGVGRLRHEGTVFHFCSLECAGAFARDPEAYAETLRRPA